MYPLILSAAQAAGAESWLESLGAFLPFGALSLAVIGWLAKKWQEERERNAELSDRLIEHHREVIPVLTAAADALGEATRELNRRDR